MEIKDEMLDDLIKGAELLRALSSTVQIGYYKGWKVELTVERVENQDS